MIKIIRHQLWNQRRQNGWIFVELVIVSFFLWTVIDPIYVLTSNLALDPGYDEERAYALYMDYYDELHGKFDKAQDSVAIRQENLYRITRLVKNCPEVESFALVTNASFPNCNSWNGGQYFNDTLKVHSQYYQFVQAEGGDVFRTFGMKDAKNGQIMSLPEDCAAREGVFVSERMAKELFGTADAVGKRVRYGDSTFHEVMGVLQDYKHRINEQPGNLLIQVNGKIPNHNWIQRMYMVTFRLKQNVDVAVFEKRFKAEVVPQLNVGNFYFTKLGRFADIRRQYENESGVTNTLRLQYSLAGFALLCVFLGMVGTFWIRCNARRQDIGADAKYGSYPERNLQSVPHGGMAAGDGGICCFPAIDNTPCLCIRFCQSYYGWKPRLLAKSAVYAFLYCQPADLCGIAHNCFIGYLCTRHPGSEDIAC